uniref:Uncharacterized protein n=1 Tax=Chromera velia CCMP2878 TaxID=1169474 RepID=A0A0G4GDD9_9ALVE|eukprot:Cvel_21315.t1-p1 / transcript=Cvel_21315.t1 / gene=Cvel_21315 / organism=Chromera_velia_CCMP2878 / gene_product=hypothetical protein / transcript_product=hypothetical protein / location=Cvel_scaffold1987:18265-21862(+) / protein_length=301 / sequence_SO=supercontig / SO=protein_coding / is_pseudo=false
MIEEMGAVFFSDMVFFRLVQPVAVRGPSSINPFDEGPPGARSVEFSDIVCVESFVMSSCSCSCVTSCVRCSWNSWSSTCFHALVSTCRVHECTYIRPTVTRRDAARRATASLGRRDAEVEAKWRVESFMSATVTERRDLTAPPTREARGQSAGIRRSPASRGEAHEAELREKREALTRAGRERAIEEVRQFREGEGGDPQEAEENENEGAQIVSIEFFPLPLDDVEREELSVLCNFLPFLQEQVADQMAIHSHLQPPLLQEQGQLPAETLTAELQSNSWKHNSHCQRPESGREDLDKQEKK